MQNVLGRDRLLADAAFGKGDILGNARIEMVADHQHVEMLGHRIDGVGPCRIGRGRNDIGEAAELDDVGRVAAARALRYGRHGWCGP